MAIGSLVVWIIFASGKNLEVSHDLTQPSIPTSLFLDCDKAFRELDWKPKIDLAEGIRLTLEWYKENIK